MYRIYADDILIYDDTSPDPAHRAVSPVLKLAAGKAGSLDITLPPGNAGYGSVRRMGSTILVLRDLQVLWKGRVLTEQKDIWGSRVLVCEGALAFLNDTVQVTDYSEGMAATAVFENALAAHNGTTEDPRVTDDRKIYRGSMPILGGYTHGRETWTTKEIIDDLVKTFGGILRIRYITGGQPGHPEGIPYLDWLDEFPPASENAQSLDFGENLLDFTRNWDMTDFSTYVYVEGALIPDTLYEQHYNSGWAYLADEPTPASLYGRLEKRIEMPELTSDQDCLSAAIDYLMTQQWGTMTLEVTAFDLHYLNRNVPAFRLLDRVQVISRPHGLDAQYVVTGIEIQMESPENTKFEMEPATVKYTPLLKTITQVVWAQGSK